MKLQRTTNDVEVMMSCDVIVVGGGPAGIGAAVAAARQGADVVLVEKRGFLGGNITACYVENCNYFVAGHDVKGMGMYQEIAEKSYEKYGNDNIRKRNLKCFSSEYLKVFLDEFVVENGVKVILHSFVNEVIKDGDHIQAVVLQTKKGPLAICPKVIVDCSGDGDVAFAAGIPFEQGREKDGLCQPGTVNMRIAGVDVEALTKDGEDGLVKLGKQFEQDYLAGKTGLPCKRKDIPFGRLTAGGVVSYCNYPCSYFLDPTDSRDLTRGEMECRSYAIDLLKYMKANWEPMKNAELASLAPEIGFRDSRRIKGLYHLTIEDCEAQKHFDDCIAAFPRFYDMLAPDANMFGDGAVEGAGYAGHIYEAYEEGRYFEVPYRSLVPVDTDNLLVAGRCIDSDHVAEAGVRAISLCVLMGEAAGVSAALCTKNNTQPKDVDIAALQSVLREYNLWIPEA